MEGAWVTFVTALKSRLSMLAIPVPSLPCSPATLVPAGVRMRGPVPRPWNYSGR